MLAQINQRQVHQVRLLGIMTKLSPNQLARLAISLEDVAQVLKDSLLQIRSREDVSLFRQASRLTSRKEHQSMKGRSEMGRNLVLYEAPLGVAERFAQATPEEAAAGDNSRSIGHQK